MKRTDPELRELAATLVNNGELQVEALQHGHVQRLPSGDAFVEVSVCVPSHYTGDPEQPVNPVDDYQF